MGQNLEDGLEEKYHKLQQMGLLYWFFWRSRRGNSFKFIFPTKEFWSYSSEKWPKLLGTRERHGGKKEKKIRGRSESWRTETEGEWIYEIGNVWSCSDEVFLSFRACEGHKRYVFLAFSIL